MFFKVGNFHWPKLQITDNNKQLLTLFLDCKVHGARYSCHINLVAIFMLKTLKCLAMNSNKTDASNFFLKCVIQTHLTDDVLVSDVKSV